VKQVLASVIAHRRVAPGIHEVHLAAPEIACDAQPGQFVHVRALDTWDPLLRRPLSLCRIGHPAGSLRPGEVSLLFEEVGRGTELLGRVEVGAKLDLLGPLGNGFTLTGTTRNALLVAGGLGIAPLVALAEKALAQEISVVLLAGAATAERLLPAEYLPAEAEYVVATDDGTLGHRGFVTDLVVEYLNWADQVFACGPLPMFDALKRILEGSSLSAQVSLEARMGCAVGACLGCVISTRRGRQRVCREGPVFDLRELL